MKKMERLSEALFRPLTEGETRRVAGGRIIPVTDTAITQFETYDPVPDFARDGDNE
jgi:hypothetical protein